MAKMIDLSGCNITDKVSKVDVVDCEKSKIDKNLIKNFRKCRKFLESPNILKTLTRNLQQICWTLPVLAGIVWLSIYTIFWVRDNMKSNVIVPFVN